VGRIEWLIVADDWAAICNGPFTIGFARMDVTYPVWWVTNNCINLAKRRQYLPTIAQIERDAFGYGLNAAHSTPVARWWRIAAS
jgi:hypothetical protein